MVYKKILCPTDFSEASFEALHRAADSAASELTEIYVVYVEPSDQPKSALTESPIKSNRGALHREELLKKLETAIEKHLPHSLLAHPVVKNGDPASGILQTAHEEGAEVIIMTTHGAGGWRNGDLGSVAGEVIRRSACPVLTIGHLAVPENSTGISNDRQSDSSLLPSITAG